MPAVEDVPGEGSLSDSRMLGLETMRQYVQTSGHLTNIYKHKFKLFQERKKIIILFNNYVSDLAVLGLLF